MTEGAAVKGSRITDGRSARWEKHRLARRTEIVEAAVRAINRYGAHVGMLEIATEARVSKPVLYRHFADQADLYRAVGRHAAQLLVDRLTLHIRPDDEPADMVATVIDVYLEGIETEPELYRFVIRYAFADDDPRDAVEGYRGMIVNLIETALQSRLAAEHRDAGFGRTWAHGLVGMVENVGEWWLEHPRQATRPQLTGQLTALIWNGLSPALRS